jgi:hypothetical protein
VIDEASVVATMSGIDSRVLVDAEQKGMMAVHRLVIVPLRLFLYADFLTGIFDNARAFADTLERKGSAALDSRVPDYEFLAIRIV